MSCGEWCGSMARGCIWFQQDDRRNAFASIAAGLLFALGWWVMIDAASVYPGDLQNSAHVCGVFATLSLLMVNMVSNAQVRGDTYSLGGVIGPTGARLWLFIGFVMGFASLIAACGILFADYIHRGKHTWPGAALLLQNVFIFLGSLVFKFGRSEENFWG